MSRLLSKISPSGLLDRMAVGLSSLCLVHCVASLVLISVLSASAGLLTSPIIHRVGLAIALLLGAAALGQGYAEHGKVRPALLGGFGLAMMGVGLIVPHGLSEVIVTVAGVSLLALAHILNGHARH